MYRACIIFPFRKDQVSLNVTKNKKASKNIEKKKQLTLQNPSVRKNETGMRLYTVNLGLAAVGVVVLEFSQIVASVLIPNAVT